MSDDLSRSLVRRRLTEATGETVGALEGAYRLFRNDVGGPEFNASTMVGPLRFNGGRSGAADEFQARTITWSYLLDDYADAPLRVGDRLILWVSLTAAHYLGIDVGSNDFDLGVVWVSDLDLEYRRVQADGDTGAEPRLVGVVTATAVGNLARVAQLRLGAAPFGADNGWHRLAGPMQALASESPTAFGFFDTSLTQRGVETAVLRPADVDRSDPVALARSYAADSGALLFESLGRAGLVWETIDGRRNREPIATLTADEIARTAHWSRSLNGLVNRLTLTYGPDSDRREVTVEDLDSIALYGEYASGRETELLYEADAQRVAQLIVARNSRPVWTIDRLDLDVLRSVDPVKAGALVTADIGDLIEVAGLPASAPYARWLYVEGNEVTVDRHNWHLSLFLSDAGRTGAPLRWQDVDPARTWADAATDDRGDPLTWFGAAAWFDPPTTSGVYRWLDVPTDQKWWHLAEYLDSGTGNYNPEIRDGGDDRVPTWESYPNDRPRP